MQKSPSSLKPTVIAFWLLCLTVLFGGLAMGGGQVLNKTNIQLAEIAFMLAYALTVCDWRQAAAPMVRHRLLFAALGGYLIALTIGSFTPFPETQASLLDRRDPDRLTTLLQLLTHGLFALCAADVINKQLGHNGTLQPLYFAFLLPGLVVITSFGYQWATQGCGADQTPCREWVHSPPFNTNIRHTGFHFSILAIIASCLFLWPTIAGRTRLVATLTCCAVFVAAVVWAGGRSSVLATIISFAVLVRLLQRHDLLIKQRAKVWASAALLGAVMGEWIAMLPFTGIFKRLLDPNRVTSIDTFSSGRIDIWRTSIEYIWQSPWFGYGGEAFINLDLNSHVLHPHNAPIQWALEAGVVGATCLMLFLAGFAWTCYHNMKTITLLRLTGFIGFFALSVSALVDGTFYHAQPLFFAVLMMVLMASSGKCSKR